MTLKIETSAWQAFKVFALAGRIEAEQIVELKELFGPQADCRNIIVDLQEVRLVDRDTVQFLAACEVQGMKLQNCPTYIREWIDKEKDRG